MKVYSLLTLLLVSNLLLGADERLKVGIFNIEPFGQLSDEGNVGGVIPKFLDMISRVTNVEMTYQLLPYPRMKSHLEQGKIQMAMFYPNKESELIFQSSICPSLGNENLIVLQNNIPANKASLDGLKIATIRNAKYEDDYDQNKKIIKVATEDYKQGLELFDLKRVDGVIIPAVALKFHLKKSKLNRELFKNSFVLNHKKNCLHFSKTVDKKLIEKIRQAHDEIIRTQKLSKLSDLL